MKVLSDYKVPFAGLSVKQHDFKFYLGNEFFEQFEYSEIEKADINVNTILDRQSSMMVFHFHLNGQVFTNCDRCMRALEIPIDFEERLVVKFGEEPGHSDEEIFVVGPHEHIIDVSQFLYEYAHLAMPSRRLCGDESECDQDVLNKLRELSSGGDDDADPRWAALKGLK